MVIIMILQFRPVDFCELLMLMFLLYFAVKNYDWLIDGTAQARVKKFIEEHHSFDEYTKVSNHTF